MLDKSVKFIADNKVRLTISKNLPKEYDIELPKKEKRLSWLKERIGIIRNQTPKYSYLLRKEVNGNKTNPVYEYYLQYTLEIPFLSRKITKGRLE